MGDGTMSSFPSARRALSAAQEIQRAMAAAGDEPRLALRIGLHTGEVVQAQDDFFGSVVNKAARIAASAGEGDIRLSDVTRAMIGAAPEFDFDGPETVLLKGLDGEHRLYRLGWQGR
jgi:class 3 adenylate cyclase